jgi:hypothetical protein
MKRTLGAALLILSLRGICQQMDLSQKPETLVKLFFEKLNRHDLNA